MGKRRSRKNKNVKSEVKEVAKPKKLSPFVTIESANERILVCNVDSKKYNGRSIEVLRKYEAGVRSVLENAGYLLK